MSRPVLGVTAGAAGAFPGAPAVRVDDLAAGPAGDVDVLVVTGADVAAAGAALRRWRGAGVAVVHLDPGRRARLQRATARLTRDVTGGGDDVLWPAVDPATSNPVGWSRRPARSCAVALHRPTPAAGAALATLPDDVLVLVPDALPGGVRRAAIGDVPARSYADADAFRDQVRRARVLVSDPAWDEDPVAVVATVARALAAGVPVVTTPDAPAVRAGLPVEVAAPAELATAAADLVADDDERERRSVRARREVLHAHTGVARWRQLAARLGLPDPVPPPRVSVLLATNRPAFVAHGARSVLGQRHPDVELVLCLHGDAVDPPPGLDAAAGAVRVVRVGADRVLGEVLNAGLDAATGTLVAKMDDDDWYGRDHLGDLVLALGYSGADVVGKRIDHVHLADRDLTVTRRRSDPERDRPHVSGPTLLTTAARLRELRFSPVPRQVDTTLLERVAAAGGRVYGTHALDVVLHRHGGNTWDADVDDLLADAERTVPGLDLASTASEPGAYVTG